MTSPLDALRERRLQLGTWLSIGAPVVAELAAECGFHWLLIDLEHGCATDTAVLPQLQAVRGTGAAVIVRVGAPHPDLIARVLDWGAHGIMVPHISSAEEAEACVRAMHYPPRGRRGVARTTRACGYGLRPPGLPGTEAAPLLMAQIENIEGVERAGEIAAVDGVDTLFVGPADLQFDLQARPELARHSFQECVQSVAAAAASAGKASGILLRETTAIATHEALGFTHIAIDSDLSILRANYQRLTGAAGII
jgi:2-keto-3-deoxy-L-rhamnonate aldolase RhmA